MRHRPRAPTASTAGRLKAGYKPGRRPERPLIARLALHAAGLTFEHPTTRQPITIQSPLPKDFQLALKRLRQYAS